MSLYSEDLVAKYLALEASHERLREVAEQAAAAFGLLVSLNATDKNMADGFLKLQQSAIKALAAIPEVKS